MLRPWCCGIVPLIWIERLAERFTFGVAEHFVSNRVMFYGLPRAGCLGCAGPGGIFEHGAMVFRGMSPCKTLRREAGAAFVLIFAGETVMAEIAAKHSKWKDIEIENLSSLIGRQLVVGTNLMVARVLLKKGAKVPLHSHFHEQVSYVLDGVLRFFIDGREIDVHSGEVLCIPPHAPHGAIALEDTVSVDIFTPPRQDWLDKDDAYLRQETDAKA